MKIDLEDIVEAIQYSTNGITHFLNTRNGDIIMQDENFGRSEYNDIEALLDENWEDIVEIPTNYDADSFGMMRDFIWDLPKGQAKDALKVAIRGQGAFARFREVCRNFGLLEEWRQYEVLEYAKFAREWCQENQIAFDEKVQVVYTRALPEDAQKLMTLKKEELGMDLDDGSLDFEMERYFSNQLRNGTLYQVLVSTREKPVATGGVQWFFVPPTPQNPSGKQGMLVNFYAEKEAADQGIFEEILIRIAREAQHRRIMQIQVPQSLETAALSNSWKAGEVSSLMSVDEAKTESR